MKTKVLVADDDMTAVQLLHDVLEITVKDMAVERALSPQAFWAKAAAVDGRNPWHIIFLSIEYIGERPETFLDRLREVNPEVRPKIVLTGMQADFDACPEDIRQLPLLSKPYSLDGFEDLVKKICG
ncbi:MAG: response regulator [Chitinispirillia bacterium]|nr:response regulator [Chitinispirillia bacterium]MCL2242133.1 response regulator [Chitinispirillia bacterium]